MTAILSSKSFHNYTDRVAGYASKFNAGGSVTTKYFVVQEREVAYNLSIHCHPAVAPLTNRLVTKSVRGLQDADTDYVKKADGSIEKLPDGSNKPVIYKDLLTASAYAPSSLIEQPYPVNELDFTSSGAYSDYNWELFFHVPLTIAIHLSGNQKFAEAQRWFHYIFDPTDSSDGPTPDRFWKVRPFQSTDVRKIEEIMINLSTGADPKLREDTILSIEAWKDQPFQPHVIARYRHQAYMYKTVMAYLDNLILWADALFRQDTGEAIDQALMLYVLAGQILGPVPMAIPSKGNVKPQTYANLRSDLDRFGNAMRDLETEVPFDIAPFPAANAGSSQQLQTIRSLGKALYFAIPRNDKMLGYWDTVADRLFKIHNSLNFQGAFRQLALFAPPIDPGLLARAAASGVDIASVIGGLNQPLPLVRYSTLAQIAFEACQEVKTLGAALLAAIEKEDGESLQLLRARHESTMMGLIEQVRYAQVAEARKTREGIERGIGLTTQRYLYYERHLGAKEADVLAKVPSLGELDRKALQDMNITLDEPDVKFRPIGMDIATDVLADVAGALNGGKIMSSHEVRESLFLEGAQLASDIGNVIAVAGSIAHLAPTLKVHVQPIGCGATVEYGGRNVGDGFAAGSGAARAVAERLNFEARRASRIDGFARREREWAFQANLAAGEIGVAFKQLRAAQLREAVAELELRNHQKMKEHSEEIEVYLNGEGTEPEGKASNKQLYAWMKREVRSLYGQVYQFAFDAARKAERALQHELGNNDVSFIKPNYLGDREGLIAGEKLHFDLRRMQMAYHDLNAREYELSRAVSLLQLSPMSLLQLRRTGRCTITVPESLFDLDAPGHYFRRLKSVAVTIPCVTGPYTSVNCTLTLLKSSVRTSSELSDGIYARDGLEDGRFSDHVGQVQSIVTSLAQNDLGLFEAGAHEERYLPFEYQGAVSEWMIELPGDPSKKDPLQFDYETISDVILHLRYMARQGGKLLRNAAVEALKQAFDVGEAIGSNRLFSVRHEFPAEWAAFQNDNAAAGERSELKLSLTEQHFPFWARGRLNSVGKIGVALESSASAPPASIEIADAKNDAAGDVKKDALAKNPVFGGLLIGRLANIALPETPVGEIKFYLPTRALKDVWISVGWSSAAA